MYRPDTNRYQFMPYVKAGVSGLKLPVVSLGFWHNFGFEKPYETVREMVLYAFDNGINHFDLANNYGQPAGSAETNLGRIIKEDLKPYRDELIISTKAGYYMWNGPYGDGGSRKYMLSSLDQSLKRLGLDYVDIFYSHRYDPDTSLEETMQALTDAVRMGKALYVGLSNYPKDMLEKAIRILKHNGTPPILYQPHFSLLDRYVKDDGSIDLCMKEGVGVIPFSVFNQGILTGKYLKCIPKDSRMANPDNSFLNEGDLNKDLEKIISKFSLLATHYKQSMTSLALKGVLNEKGITSALIGVSKLEQLKEIIDDTRDIHLDAGQIEAINQIFIR